MWPAILEAVKTYSKVAWMTFKSSRPVSLSNGELAVAVGDVGAVKALTSSGHDERLRQAILDVMRVDVKVSVILAPDKAVPVTAPAPSSSAPAESTEPATSGEEAPPPPADEPDAPSMDDADMDDASGVDLAMREFGATQIGEIEH